ncbi:MAG: Veg family protein [Bacilli bacterium]|nr:Veg family protein [Bacilli bacterium]MDD4795153.1 Veg family protein [Bacilli bacterium]
MIETIKNEIYNHLNKEVKVVSKENRNRNEIFYGNIIEIYSHVFIVSNGIDKKSYTYSDILARDIQITFL